MPINIIYFAEPAVEYKQVLEMSIPEDYQVWHWYEMSEDEQKSKLPLAEYFLIFTSTVNGEIIAKAERLRLIQRTGIGVNNVDVAMADSLDIPVANLPSGNAIAVAEHAMLLPLALQRRLIELNADTKAGNWPLWKYRTTSYEMDGKTHGFLGFGNIGKATAARSRAFGTRIIYNDLCRAPEAIEHELGASYMSKEEVLAKADIVSLHIPFTAENKSYIGKRELSLMKKNAFLINVSRGGLVDEHALFEALVTGKIAGAGIDTWETEPCPATNQLFMLPNVIATAHVAAGTLDTFRKQVRGSLENIVLAEKTGCPRFIVGRAKKIRQ